MMTRTIVGLFLLFTVSAVSASGGDAAESDIDPCTANGTAKTDTNCIHMHGQEENICTVYRAGDLHVVGLGSGDVDADANCLHYNAP